jgi:DNA primase
VITHPEKVLFPGDGITKGELAAYYEAVAPLILPHLRGRPVTMERYPSGIGAKGFWQKPRAWGASDPANSGRGNARGEPGLRLAI